ncbi:MAG: ABC transporter ATP-binding protein/permease [Actinomycetota bacterium]|nr:ABC transporter ATP-binding protein/permease [Actinomycetota bacterium]
MRGVARPCEPRPVAGAEEVSSSMAALDRDIAALGRAHEFEPPPPEGAQAPPPLARVDPDRELGWYRRVQPLLVARKGQVLLGLGCALVAMLAQVVAPRVLMTAIDRALDEGGSPLGPFVIALLVIAVVRGALTLTYRSVLFRAAYGLEYDLRTSMYEHLTRMSFSFYDQVQTGQLISRANSDIRAVQLFLTFMPIVALNFVSFIVAVAMMVTIDLPLTVIAVLPLPFVYVIGVRMRELLFPLSWIVQARAADVSTIVEENVTGARVVKSFAAEQQQLDQLALAARKLRWVSITQVDVRARFAPLMEALPRIGLAAVLLYGGLAAIDGRVSVGAIVAFSSYVVLLQAPFRTLGFILLMGQRAAASADRIFEILDTEPAVEERPGAVDLLEPRGEVELRDVTFRYADGGAVLEHLDLHLAPGDRVAVIGRTGTGKSTIARLLPRFYDVEEGAVLVDGHDVRHLTLRSLRASIGLVLDEPFLFAASVRDNIAYGRPDASDGDVRAAARAAGAEAFIDDLPDGFDTEVGERGYTLSGGQRQRIAIARTLLADPAILILDDATSAIDVHVEEEIHAALRVLMEGRTTLVIAHRTSTISLAERVVLLDGGRIAAEGSHAQLMATEPRYAEVLAHIDEVDAARRAQADAAVEAAALGDDAGGAG